MTPVDEAVERVKAYVEAMGNVSDDWRIDHEHNCETDKSCPLDLGDLRALLSALELGSVASLPVVTADEPATPLSAVLLAEASVYLRQRGYDSRGTVCDDDKADTFIAMAQAVADAARALSASTTDSGKAREPQPKDTK